MQNSWVKLNLFFLGIAIIFPTYAFAAGGGKEADEWAKTTFALVIILILGRTATLVEKIAIPAVLGELVIGIILGNVYMIGITSFTHITADHTIAYLTKLGAVILLFQIGIETKLEEIKAVGIRSFFVALVGVLVPFVFGVWVIGPWLFPGLALPAYLFLGASLTATSVGITGRVLKDYGFLEKKEGQIIIGAAFFDDVMGIVTLAVIFDISKTGTFNPSIIMWIVTKATLFLILSILLGQVLAPHLSKVFSKINTGAGMKFTLAISIALLMAFLSHNVGLDPIIGAFAGGLFLAPDHFKYFKDPELIEEIKHIIPETKDNERLYTTLKHHAEKHLEELILPVAFLFVPLFFIVTGMHVKLSVFSNPTLVFKALIFTIFAYASKYVACYVAGNNVKKSIIGWGMIPRGEVGLIIASIGVGMSVIGPDLFAVIVIQVIFTTFIPPLILSIQIKKYKAQT